MAAVVGGGIAGLASAVSLAQAGWQVTVLERAPVFGEVGAGLAVTGNGMTALAALGLDRAVRAAGSIVPGRPAALQRQHQLAGGDHR
jgi:2-polyprenyl-6-methoxyphenol hydroxylase-like FAD-dependent oxidoreductase